MTRPTGASQAARRRTAAKTAALKADIGKATMVRKVAGTLAQLDVGELRKVSDFVAKIAKRSNDTIVAIYPGPAAVKTSVAVRTADGSTWIGRTAPNAIGMSLIEPKTKVSVKNLWRAQVTSKPKKAPSTALERARAGYESLRDEIVRQSLSLTKAAARMDLTPEGLSSRVDRGEILAFPDKNRKMVPVELIDDEQPTRTVRGLNEVIAASRMEPFRLAIWLLSPSRSLGARRPVDELRSGNVEKVVRAVKGLDAT